MPQKLLPSLAMWWGSDRDHGIFIYRYTGG
jgi:hypothetical protein